MRRYLDDQDTRITRPLRLFVVVLVVYFATASLGGVDKLNGQAWERMLEPQGIRTSGFTEFLSRYQTALYALVLPLMMVAARVAWPRSGRTLAEHLILNTYLFPMQLLIQIPLALAAAGLAWVGFETHIAFLDGVVGPVVSIGYAAWMMATFFPGSRIWSAIRAIAIQQCLVIYRRHGLTPDIVLNEASVRALR